MAIAQTIPSMYIGVETRKFDSAGKSRDIVMY